MEVSYRPYYQLNEYFLSFVGLWPYQSKLKQQIITPFVMLTIWTLMVGELLGLYKHWGDLDTTIDCIPSLFYNFVGSACVLACSTNRPKMELLFFKIKKDWSTWTSGPESKILHSYASQGRKVVIILSVYIYIVTFDILLVPFMAPILDYFIPLNESRLQKPIVVIDFFIDMEDNYYTITFYSIVSILILTTAIVSVDSALIVVLYHACGELAILGFKLKNLTEMNDRKEDSDRIKIQQEIKFCSEKHESVIIFVNDICDYLSTAYFLHMGFHMVMMSVTGVQTLMHLDNLREANAYAMFAVGQLVHLFWLTVPSQSLINHSLQLSENIYSGCWYEMSCQSKKKLLMIMMRSSKPCKFTAGKLYTFSMESFAAVVRTSMSYFTVLLSLRE